MNTVSLNAQEQVPVRATYMRGGTSKGVFFVPEDLPLRVRSAGIERDHFLLRLIGSPDPYERQIDGMGGATSSTSKVVLVSRSQRPDFDVDYLFGAVAIDRPVVDWSGNCGNLSAAVGPFAIERGMLVAPAEGIATVRIWQANIRKRIVAHVPMHNGRVVESGNFQLDGVTFPGAEIMLDFIEPASDDEGSGPLFPTGSPIDTLMVDGVGTLQATLINAGNPTVFILAESVGLKGIELQSDVNNDVALLTRLEAIRATAAVMMGLARSPEQATQERPATPKLAFIAAPAQYIASSGKPVYQSDVDVLVRILSMGKLHHALTGTGAVAVAAAAAVPGTSLAQVMGDRPHASVRIGHPSGVLSVGAEVRQASNGWDVRRVSLSRTARRLMDGSVFVPAEYLMPLPADSAAE